MTDTLPQTAPGHLYTCLACQVAFHSAELQRNHYRSDWHRYNLKRKIAELPPVNAENFAQRVLNQQAQSTEEAKQATEKHYCLVCRKQYGSNNAYQSHLVSKKHRETEQRQARQAKQEPSGKETNTTNAPVDRAFPVSEDEGDVDQGKPSTEAQVSTTAPQAESEIAVPTEGRERPLQEALAQEREINRALDQAQTEEEFLALIDKKMKCAPRLAPEDCLFCPHHSATFEANMDHMKTLHSFFIPDAEYLTDLRGLITYLGEKVTVANVCLYCNGRGRGLRSTEAVRRHMQDKGHCMIAYSDEVDILEISDYYDFSTSYPDHAQAKGAEDMEIDAASGPSDGRRQARAVDNNVAWGDSNLELVLPSGARVGHRDLRHYYRQRFDAEDTRESVLIHQLRTQDPEGSSALTPAERQAKERALILSMTKGKWAFKQMTSFREQKTHENFRSRVGVKANKLQRYFRAQILF
ncbi:pre-60S factor rei1 [Dispira simplex]|nr:pre-60S factor rei1 [Dispira simplex]